MCGLCGVYGFISADEKRVFASLQLFSQLRGRDSTGLAVLPFTPSGSAKIFKGLGGVESLVVNNKDAFDQKNWNLNLATNGVCLIGHHRHATSGSINEESAHPFDLDNIVGCHNGTIHDYSIVDLPSYSKDLIDSQIILKEIDGGRPLNEIIKDVKGAWALVWWDKSTSTLNMCRNEERSLHIAITKDNRSLFWASEPWMLDVSLRRAGFPPENFKILDTTPDKHLIWGRDSKYKVELQDSLVAKAVDTYRWSAWGVEREKEAKKNNIVNIDRKSKRKARKEQIASLKERSESREEEFTEVYARTFEGLYIKKREYEHLTRKGCSWCGVKEDVSWDKREEVTWYDVDHPVCDVCETVTSEVEAARKVH